MIRYRAPFHAIKLALALTAFLGATACTQVPELDATIPDGLRNAPYPKLQELDPALFTAALPQERAQEVEESLEARRDRLRARAARLNTPVVDPQARKRLQSGVQQ